MCNNYSVVAIPCSGFYRVPFPVGESLNSLDLRNGGVALYLENFNRLNCTSAVLSSALKIDSSLLPSLVPSLK